MVDMDNFISIKPIAFKILYNLQILRLFSQFYFHYAVREYVKKGDVVIDIGANWGCYTRLFSKWGAEVYAVEPVPKFRIILRKLIGMNVIPYAFGNENKFIGMEHYHEGDGWYRVSDKGQLAEMIKGSRMFGGFWQINFIKIDVEGSELPIIEDMAELILKHRPTILIETGKINEVLTHLKGYKIIDQYLNDYLIA
jgi:FkbM family methyltransferase